MATTTNYGWTTPDNTALVKDGASAIRTLGSSVDTTVKALSPGTTAGDVDYYTSSTAKARLGIGTTGQVLTVAGGVPSWATASSGGMTLISTTSLTGASVTASSIPSTYNELRIVVKEYKPVTNGYLFLRLNGNSGTVYYSTTINSSGPQAFNSTRINLNPAAGQNNSATSNSLVVFNMPEYASTTTWKNGYGLSMMNDQTSSADFSWSWNMGFTNLTAAISSVTLLPQSGNFTSGTMLIYGVK
jgi:hypothetical protein